jgi:hypothetical protein
MKPGVTFGTKNLLFLFVFAVMTTTARSGNGDGTRGSDFLQRKNWHALLNPYTFKWTNGLSDELEYSDHSPVWSIGVGVAFTTTTLGQTPAQQAYMGVEPNSQLSGKAGRAGGAINIPLVSYRSDLVLGVAGGATVTSGSNTINLSLPLYATFRIGSGSSHHSESRLNLGGGIGAAYNQVNYQGSENFNYGGVSPAFLMEIGYGAIAFRLDYMLSSIKTQTPLQAHFAYQEKVVTFIYYFLYDSENSNFRKTMGQYHR